MLFGLTVQVKEKKYQSSFSIRYFHNSYHVHRLTYTDFFYGECKNQTLGITKKNCVQNLPEYVVLELQVLDLMYLQTTCFLLLSGKLPKCVHGKCISPIKQAFCFFKGQNRYKSHIHFSKSRVLKQR